MTERQKAMTEWQMRCMISLLIHKYSKWWIPDVHLRGFGESCSICLYSDSSFGRQDNRKKYHMRKILRRARQQLINLLLCSYGGSNRPWPSEFSTPSYVGTNSNCVRFPQTRRPHHRLPGILQNRSEFLCSFWETDRVTTYRFESMLCGPNSALIFILLPQTATPSIR